MHLPPHLAGAIHTEVLRVHATDLAHELDSLGWGTTAAEQRGGEPLSMKIARERPDVVRADPDTVELVPTDDAERDYGDAVDTEGQGLSAEEAAVHVVEPDASRT